MLSEPRPILCTKRVPVLCENKATEILYVREPGTDWEEYPRCPDHPAVDDVAMIQKIAPLAETKIEPVGGP